MKAYLRLLSYKKDFIHPFHQYSSAGQGQGAAAEKMERKTETKRQQSNVIVRSYHNSFLYQNIIIGSAATATATAESASASADKKGMLHYTNCNLT